MDAQAMKTCRNVGKWVFLSIFTFTIGCNKGPARVKSVEAIAPIEPIAAIVPQNKTIPYCIAVVKAEEEAALTKPFSAYDELGRRCKDLAFRLNGINTSMVDRSFVSWTATYTNLLLEMTECCDFLAQRKSPNYQTRRLIEAFLRGGEGDPFGVAIEELSAMDQERAILKAFESRRLKQLFEFQREFNAIAPESLRANVGR